LNRGVYRKFKPVLIFYMYVLFQVIKYIYGKRGVCEHTSRRKIF